MKAVVEELGSSAPRRRRGALWPLSVAPMMEWTDRHFRWMLRLLTKRTLLYTEMVTAVAVVRGARARLLEFDPQEHPLALQLGGDDPKLMAEAARIGRDFGYDEINVNVGCPSDRVRSGSFGACLMAEPERVAEIVAAIRAAVDVPVTVKHRIGINGLDRYEDLAHFVEVVSAADCDRFIVHARIAVLGGLSPVENRTVPPLRYSDVYLLKREFPHLAIEINGGFRDLIRAREQLDRTDGVMMGRAVYENPYVLAEADATLFGTHGTVDSGPQVARAIGRRELAEAMIPYLERESARGVRPAAVTRHMMGLFAGIPGARAWRRHLSENGPRAKDGGHLLRYALRAWDGASKLRDGGSPANVETRA